MDGDKGLNEMLSSVLNNRELMDKISGIVKESGANGDDTLSRVVEAMSQSVGKGDEAEKEPQREEEKPVFNEKKAGGVSFLSNKSGRDSAALLRAIKPFLCKERCDMVDNILKFEQLASIIKLTR